MILCVRTSPPALLAVWHRSPELRGKPIVLGGLPHERLPVVAVSPEARVTGVVEGMSVREAEQRCPQAVFQPVDVEASTRLRSAMLSALYAFTPQVAPADEHGYAYLQLDGLTLRWPDRTRLLTAITGQVQAMLDIPPVLGVGVNLFVSRIAADRATPGKPLVVEAAATAGFLFPLPIICLPLDDELREYLELLGLRTLGSLRTIPRVAWQRQFGTKALQLYDLAWGIDTRQLIPWQPPSCLKETMPLDPPLDNVEALQFIARGLVDRLSESLQAKALGARRILVRLDQDSAPAIQMGVRFAYPVSAGADLFAGVRARLLRVRPVAPLERITLTLRQLEPAYVRQPGLLLRRDGQRESLADAVLRLQEEYRPGLVQRASRADRSPPLATRRIEWRPA